MLKLSLGQAGGVPHGCELLRAGGPAPPDCQLLVACAYEGDETRELARGLGYQPVVPPTLKRLRPWQYDRVAYRRRNEIESLFRDERTSVTRPVVRGGLTNVIIPPSQPYPPAAEQQRNRLLTRA